MLDVLHYLFDEDLVTVSDSEHAKYKNSVRQIIYKNMYDRDYKYGGDEISSSQNFSDDDYIPQGGAKGEVKPYFPPTKFNPDAPNPFQGALREAPLG